MKKLHFILSLLVFALAAGSALVTSATSSEGMRRRTAYEALPSGSCQSITVDDNCSSSGMHPCVNGKTIWENGPPQCSTPLFKP